MSGSARPAIRKRRGPAKPSSLSLALIPPTGEIRTEHLYANLIFPIALERFRAGHHTTGLPTELGIHEGKARPCTRIT